MRQLETTSLEAAREQTRRLVEGLEDEDLERVHSPLMSPLVWDLGHIAAFEDLWVAHREGGLELLRPDLMDVYDAFETPRADRGSLPYLRRSEAEEFLADVRRRVRELPVGDGFVHELVARHELQHNETMLQTLNLARIGRPGAEEPGSRHGASGLDLVDVPGGAVPVGSDSFDGRPETFSYDNERPVHTVELAGFRIGRVPVTNGDWLHFVGDAGYSRREWWSPEGWAWRVAEGIERPMNWLGDELEWRLPDGASGIDRRRPVVHISWYEADAFARSRGLRLPTEAEWEAAATWDGTARRAGTPGTRPGEANLIESGILGTAPAGAFGEGAAPCGALDMIGGVWEWTAGEFGGYPGFVAHPYREYSEVFFGPDHRVLRGGSFGSSARVITPAFRNWDYPQRRQIFAGVRMAADA
ncbi:MAG: SUMF1/EgtB/PvdO family nonheme iron enzyme [Actinobacteria bacterium]|nr:SUMF1/EgtB/PvdO family nonheme iron enzyme [Actinomycetota bacterium]